ncbi:cell division protein FtsW [Pseudoalteromonas sp. 13-15]|jgi:cell division protein FtsW|uniref:Probable peptidoglycan glycosyltransferase FtsW n=1 Tax=Pseudoalteromonas marina TaxID=267375 RepID=A0ABT9F8F5_9GAMM|nr:MULTISPECIES: cell division protein FtsW [Pseudoalteromonas]EAW28733.1 Cell division protein FtsW [Alteromonadales bacterium TW-7]MBL1384252.1 cell division protein FtsW [Colwellia sp.]ATG59149.1 cell division protein FtsW [Pseudoalteromonas marina]AUL74662.1 cell division protein FtsW [Pseudoalteromonas sp. 13-15]KAF7779434.1 cell division protein FtsW [Pseudoalteromonas marina]|tara:strand:+ start:1293 stop:2468 length:1176 start_codon:yes stop_codon:yes gene_type:complete
MIALAQIKDTLTPKPSPQLYDVPLLYSMLMLIGVGFIMVMSASMPTAERLFDNSHHIAIRHGMFLAVAFVLFWITVCVPMDWWKRSNAYLLILGMVLLIAVLIIGREVNGAKRWIPIGPIGFQVAEAAKLYFFSYIAGYLVRKREEVQENIKGFAKPIAVFAVYALLILLQPDLGTVVVMFVTTVGLLFLAGAKLWQFFVLILTGIGLVVLLIIVEPYRMARVVGFLDPWDDPFGKGYQLVQSLMAYSQGGWFGQGLGNSVQKLQYLPEAHNDFIFAVIGEELGLVGVVSILMVLATLVFRALLIGQQALKCGKEYEGYFAFAIGIWFAFQTMVNVGASAGILPTKGLTLPFISYGGSSLMIMTIATGILLRVDFETKMATKQATSGGGKR